MSCIKCSILIDEKTDKFIRCDMSNRFIHVVCSELSDAEVKCFTLRPNSRRRIKFICCECEQSVNQIPKLITLINDLQNEIKNLNERFSELRNCTGDVATASNTSVMLSHEEIFSEMFDRNMRSHNIIIYGSVEDAGSKQEQFLKDDATIRSMLQQLGVRCDQVKPTRLGRFDPSKQQRSRPIRVRLSSPDDAFKIFRKFKNIKNDARFANLSVSSDRTPKQRAAYKAVRSILAERTSKGETNLKIKYRNGVPTIVHIKSNSVN